ncbi:MAG: TusE/DsrC/DsvC family sulfur relay protein [Thermodesulfobacteriota bacterium]
MTSLQIGGKAVELDENGFLVRPEEWSEEVARALAEREGRKLDEEEMDILCFMRQYYARHKAFPILNYVCKRIDQPRQCVREKFLDPMKAWQLAGLPKPGVIDTEAADAEHKIFTWLVPD